MSKNFDYIGHRKRIKDKYLQAGLKGFKDYEILELLLTLAIPRKDTKSLAKNLLKKFGCLHSVLEASKTELMSAPGAGENVFFVLSLLKDVGAIYLKDRLREKDVVSSPQMVYEYLQISLKGFKNEVFKALFLNSRNEVIDSEILQEGTVAHTTVTQYNYVGV